jgi:hypothetical protein
MILLQWFLYMWVREHGTPREAQDIKIGYELLPQACALITRERAWTLGSERIGLCVRFAGC